MAESMRFQDSGMGPYFQKAQDFKKSGIPGFQDSRIPEDEVYPRLWIALDRDVDLYQKAETWRLFSDS